MNQAHPFIPRRNGFCACRGQALLESLLMILLICLVAVGFFQLAVAFAHNEIMHHAAARVARAKTVGFNEFMVGKVARVASIPAAGPMTTPAAPVADPLRELILRLRPGASWDLALAARTAGAARNELSLLPFYLEAENHARADAILDYERWDEITNHSDDNGLRIRSTVSMLEPLLDTFRLLFSWTGETIELRGESELENHYNLYMEDWNW